ncbi:uncharacterized protein BJ171DRAFT_582494 [Polychytrium aggregatum]|uniref:uncharacterized protein n=1 Tax=Polychytrium aggregatum TaxID=110093 RepID=UPI0022FDBD35|nr:uncharacterized protein BJ171DRAFT_582494 [Polychytrium aggregatum]KAI9204116.1 hypothetical protein BJ171DRAFT_582494 [Polychytrium aggregatum]
MPVPSEPAKPRAKRFSVVRYNLREKLKIVTEAYSKPRNIKPTARRFGIPAPHIRRWHEQRQDIIKRLEENKEENLTIHRGRRPKYPEVDKGIQDFIDSFKASHADQPPQTADIVLYVQECHPHFRGGLKEKILRHLYMLADREIITLSNRRARKEGQSCQASQSKRAALRRSQTSSSVLSSSSTLSPSPLFDMEAVSSQDSDQFVCSNLFVGVKNDLIAMTPDPLMNLGADQDPTRAYYLDMDQAIHSIDALSHGALQDPSSGYITFPSSLVCAYDPAIPPDYESRGGPADSGCGYISDTNHSFYVGLDSAVEDFAQSTSSEHHGDVLVTPTRRPRVDTGLAAGRAAFVDGCSPYPPSVCEDFIARGTELVSASGMFQPRLMASMVSPISSTESVYPNAYGCPSSPWAPSPISPAIQLCPPTCVEPKPMSQLRRRSVLGPVQVDAAMPPPTAIHNRAVPISMSARYSDLAILSPADGLEHRIFPGVVPGPMSIGAIYTPMAIGLPGGLIPTYSMPLDNTNGRGFAETIIQGSGCYSTGLVERI